MQYVEATSSPARQEASTGSECSYVTRSIGRYIVVSGTEFESTSSEPLPPSRDEPASGERIRSAHPTPTSDGSAHVDLAPTSRPDTVVRVPGASEPNLGLRSAAYFGSALLSVVGSAFSFSLPFSVGGIAVPGASVLAATSAPTFSCEPVVRAARLPRPEDNWRAALRCDSGSLLLAWIEAGDECDKDVTDLTQTWDITDGPAWRLSLHSMYKVTVRDPVVSNVADEAPHVLYTVSTIFEALPDCDDGGGAIYDVARRFSDFAALDHLLRWRYFHPLITVPPLPTKGDIALLASKFDSQYLERRARLLTEWVGALRPSGLGRKR